jgi:hypothetical protein
LKGQFFDDDVQISLLYSSYDFEIKLSTQKGLSMAVFTLQTLSFGDFTNNWQKGPDVWGFSWNDDWES